MCVLAGTKSERNIILHMLNEVLTRKISNVLRFKRHHHIAKSLGVKDAVEKYACCVLEEHNHADRLTERIVQLEGIPNFHDGHGQSCRHSQYAQVKTLPDLIEEDFEARKALLESYRALLTHSCDIDPVTNRLVQEIIASEEIQMNELSSLMTANSIADSYLSAAF